MFSCLVNINIGSILLKISFRKGTKPNAKKERQQIKGKRYVKTYRQYRFVKNILNSDL